MEGDAEPPFLIVYRTPLQRRQDFVFNLSSRNLVQDMKQPGAHGLYGSERGVAADTRTLEKATTIWIDFHFGRTSSGGKQVRRSFPLQQIDSTLDMETCGLLPPQRTW
jgi:hypothetical protein